ncbi:VCBS repeat-containing protein [Dokdonia sp. Asnod2-E02]|uniref:VCBS repeat-containing protein n=1 Tax=Dokdonia sp. Asnod2-E02 TaxID=3160574 RepID=UPI00386665C2
MKQLYTLLISILILSCGDKTEQTILKETSPSKVVKTKDVKIFEQISSDSSGITFSNTLKEDVGSLANLFDFDYFYNGAGVGVADVNNDGLQDLFFTGNQVPNKLYLNKGNLQFEDISDAAGINVGKQWANGVTFADVNNDGLIDIYVSQGGPKQAQERGNLLYINEGENRFRESAKQYNISDTGISTQSSFFDFDKDGDLDLVVSNENELYGLDPQRFFASMKIRKNLEKSSVQLYENTGNTFKNVTERAGLLKPAFGLGLVVSDINNDGWLDLYIANDYYVPDAMYINNQDGTFTDKIKEQTAQVSFYGMGVDIADVNNDMLQDIFVLDMAASDHVRSKTLMASMNEQRFNMLTEDMGFQHQYMFNSLQLNRGNGRFDNVVHQAHMAKTDWSWAGLIADLDNDADRDVYVTNGYRRYALDNDLQNQVRDTQRAFNGTVPLDVKQKLYDAMPTEKLSNIAFINNGDLDFKNNSYQWGLAVASYSNGGAYADLDNDGDLELITNNIDDTAFLFKNTSVENKLGNFIKIKTKGTLSEDFAKVTIITKNGTQVAENKRTRGYLSAVEEGAHFGLGTVENVDKVIVQWLSGKRSEFTDIKANQTLVVKENEATLTGLPVIDTKEPMYAFAKAKNDLGIDFSHKENTFNDFTKEVLLPYKQSQLGPFISKGDANNDGLEDLFIGGAAGQAGALYIQSTTGFNKISQPALDKDKAYEDMESLFVDVDGDGDQDLIVVSGGNEFAKQDALLENRLYLNDGAGNYDKAAFDQTGNNRLVYSKSIAAIDFDQDGDQDIVIGNRIEQGQFPVSASSVIYRNDRGVFTDVTVDVAPDLLDFGIINDVLNTDYDNDGKEDLLIVGEWSPIGLLKNIGGHFVRQSLPELDENLGLWFTAVETDVNNDGIKDYVIGNIGENTKYKASKKKPFKVFANDFDNNGTFDLVLSNEYNGSYVPARGRECSSQQMPFILDKFATYSDFANATLDDIYGDALKEAYTKEVNTFSSILLIGHKDGGFTTSMLPAIAQSGPGLSIETVDVNDDGCQDLILAGAIYETEVETPRYDAGVGVVLLSNKKDGYKGLSTAETLLFLDGNVKDVASITHKGLSKKLLISAVNNGQAQVVNLD